MGRRPRWRRPGHARWRFNLGKATRWRARRRSRAGRGQGTGCSIVTLLGSSPHSHHAYESREKARRAFVSKAVTKPYARMVIRLHGEARRIVIREGRRAVSASEAAIVDLGAIKTALRLGSAG